MNMQTRIAAIGGLLAVAVDSKALAESLALFKASHANIIEGRNTIPILGCVRLEASPDKLTIQGTDLDVQLTVEMPAASDGGGVICTEFKALEKAARAARGTVRIIDQGCNAATLASDAGTVRLPTLSPADWPVVAMPPALDTITLPAGQFAADLARVAPCISTEETRYYLNGVFFHVGEDEFGRRCLKMAATDGHRLARISREAGDDVPEFPDGILPRKAAEWIRRKGCKADGTVSFGWDFGRFVFIAGRVRLVGKLIDGTFPDYSRVIPYAEGRRLEFDADALADAVASATAQSSERTKAMTLSVGEGWMSAYSVDPDAGRAFALVDGSEYFPPSNTGETEYATGFNAGYLGDAMGMFAGQRVRMWQADPGAPTLFRSDASPEMTAVLMPMRVDSMVWSPAALRKLTRDACQIFAEDAGAKVKRIAEIEERVRQPHSAYGPGDLRDAKRELGGMVTAAINLMAARTGWPRHLARLTILRDLADMRGQPEPWKVKAAAAAEKALARGLVMAGPELTPEPAVPAQPTPLPEPGEAAPADEPEEQPVDSEPETPEAYSKRIRDAQPMFRTLQDFKAAAGVGSRWRLSNYNEAEGWSGQRYVTVATVRARSIGFLRGAGDGKDSVFTIDDCRAADVKGFGGRTWIDFPAKGRWQSDCDGLVTLFNDGTPCMKIEPAPMPVAEPAAVSPAEGQPVAEPGELEALRAAVAALTARVEAMEAGAAANAPAAPVEAIAARRQRSPGHAAAIRRAWLYRKAFRSMRSHAANVGTLRDLYLQERDVERERADEEKRRADSNARTWQAEYDLRLRLQRRVDRLVAVLKGRKAQIAQLGRDLLVARNRAVDLRAAGEMPGPVAIETAAEPAPVQPNGHRRHFTTHKPAQMQRRGNRYVIVG